MRNLTMPKFQDIQLTAQLAKYSKALRLVERVEEESTKLRRASQLLADQILEENKKREKRNEH